VREDRRLMQKEMLMGQARAAPGARVAAGRVDAGPCGPCPGSDAAPRGVAGGSDRVWGRLEKRQAGRPYAEREPRRERKRFAAFCRPDGRNTMM
jgi:hypothetical protein